MRSRLSPEDVASAITTDVSWSEDSKGGQLRNIIKISRVKSVMKEDPLSVKVVLFSRIIYQKQSFGRHYLTKRCFHRWWVRYWIITTTQWNKIIKKSRIVQITGVICNLNFCSLTQEVYKPGTFTYQRNKCLYGISNGYCHRSGKSSCQQVSWG